MSKSWRLRLSDVRAAFRLLSDCRDLGGHWEDWYLRMLEGLRPLIGARVVMGTETPRFSPSPTVKIAQDLHHIGPDPKPRDGSLESLGQRIFGGASRVFCLQRLTGRLATLTRRHFLEDSEWYGSDCFQDYFRPAGVDHHLHSLCELSDGGTINWIVPQRAMGEPDFSPRDRRLLHLFHDELGRLIGPVLAPAGQPDPRRHLTPRLRQTLECLLEGDSEKQVALRLGLSRKTVHQYVTELYRRFDVGSRAELLAMFLKRSWRVG